jgi:hypothetical protein
MYKFFTLVPESKEDAFKADLKANPSKYQASKKIYFVESDEGNYIVLRGKKFPSESNVPQNVSETDVVLKSVTNPVDEFASATGDILYANLVTVDADNGPARDGNAYLKLNAQDVTLKNVTINESEVPYNYFEQTTKTPLETLTIENLTAIGTLKNHNFVSLYNLADGATITFRNCDLSFTSENALVRFANYLNADNVNVVFENCKWVFSQEIAESDYQYCGLMILQPASTDVAKNGADLSHYKTWHFTFRDCYYDGEKITDLGIGTIHQLITAFYMHETKTTANVEDLGLEDTITIE